MTYTTTRTDTYVFAFLDGKNVGKFDIDIFLTKVISPLEFRRFERNPDKNKFYIRKIEFNNHNLKQSK